MKDSHKKKKRITLITQFGYNVKLYTIEKEAKYIKYLVF